jgi:hypothetical protein
VNGTQAVRAIHRRLARPELEAALTIGVALVVGLLGLLGVVDLEVVSAATLSILALICFDMMGSRRHYRGTESAVHALASTVGALQRHLPADAVTVVAAGAVPGLAHARDIRLVGVTLNRTIRNQLATLESCLTTGGTVRIVLIDPASSAAREAARRNGLSEYPDVFEHRIRPTIDLLHYLAALPNRNGDLHVRFTTYVPSFGLTMVDPDTAYGRLTVDIYSHRPGEREPVLSLAAADNLPWYRHFRSEFDYIWESARPADPGDGLGNDLRPLF